MPTYEYECRKCRKVFEVFQGISEKPLTRCRCEDKGRVKRLLGTGAGFLFKGSGFYTTDYRSDSYKQGAKAADKSASSSPDAGASGSKTAASGKKDSPTKTTT